MNRPSRASKRALAGLRPSLVAAVVAVVALTGCADAFGDRDPKSPGEQLGTFHVTGTRTENTCGEGALNAGTTWAFDIGLSREGSTLYWNNGGEGVDGTIADDGVTFQFDATVAVNMRGAGDEELPPCTVSRRDRGSGALDAPADVTSFKGTLRYDFAPTVGSSCDDLVYGETPLFAALPCGFAYAIQATRADAE